ncbi:MAG: hypothetical protein HOC74_07510 [Gemmatimonadetes bacterium]|jgi:parvulin-like peptidyl-prolyl isomerase|nr:hypothetical protein [Gemmatimonadota bacterium]
MTRAALNSRHLFLLTLFLVIGCAREREEPRALPADIVAKIDSATVTIDQLRSFVIGLPPGLLANEREDEAARTKYLRSLLARHLLSIEARERQLDQLPELRTKLMERWRQHIVTIYRQQALASEVRISEEDIRTYFEQSGLDRQRQFAGILVADESLAQKIKAQLEAGGDFAELAAAHTIDQRSADRGGLLGYIDIEQAYSLRIPAEIFRSLPIGDISPVLPMGENYQIVRFLHDRPVALDEKRQQIRDLLYERGLADAEEREIRRLERKLEFRLVPEGVALLQDKASLHTRVRRQHLSPQESVQPLFTYKGGQVTLGDYLDLLWKDMRALSGWGTKDTGEILEASGALVLGKMMLFEAARRGGITERPEEQRWLAEIREELMITQLRQQEVISNAEVSREEAEDFYDDHEEIFREETQYIFVELLVETEAEATAHRSALERGETISSLAQQFTVRPGMREEAGMTHMGAYERITQPLLYEAVRRAERDEIVGPLRVKDGYCLFKLLDRQEGKLKPFLEVEARARALVRAQKKERLFEEWIDALLEKYDDRISISDQALVTALPDTLLQRLTDRLSTENDQ